MSLPPIDWVQYADIVEFIDATGKVIFRPYFGGDALLRYEKATNGAETTANSHNLNSTVNSLPKNIPPPHRFPSFPRRPENKENLVIGNLVEPDDSGWGKRKTEDPALEEEKSGKVKKSKKKDKDDEEVTFGLGNAAPVERRVTRRMMRDNAIGDSSQPIVPPSTFEDETPKKRQYTRRIKAPIQEDEKLEESNLAIEAPAVIHPTHAETSPEPLMQAAQVETCPGPVIYVAHAEICPEPVYYAAAEVIHMRPITPPTPVKTWSSNDTFSESPLIISNWTEANVLDWAKHFATEDECAELMGLNVSGKALEKVILSKKGRDRFSKPLLQKIIYYFGILRKHLLIEANEMLDASP